LVLVAIVNVPPDFGFCADEVAGLGEVEADDVDGGADVEADVEAGAGVELQEISNEVAIRQTMMSKIPFFI
jgi:hypothetical protein